MLKNNIKKLVISLIAVLLVVSIGHTVFATNGDEDINKLLSELHKEESGEQIGEDEELEQIPEGAVDEEPEVDETLEDTDGTDEEKEERPETTPHAGLEDNIGLIFIAVFVVLAVYAYKKIREYNV